MCLFLSLLPSLLLLLLLFGSICSYHILKFLFIHINPYSINLNSYSYHYAYYY